MLHFLAIKERLLPASCMGIPRRTYRATRKLVHAKPTASTTKGEARGIAVCVRRRRQLTSRSNYDPRRSASYYGTKATSFFKANTDTTLGAYSLTNEMGLGEKKPGAVSVLFTPLPDIRLGRCGCCLRVEQLSERRQTYCFNCACVVCVFVSVPSSL